MSQYFLDCLASEYSNRRRKNPSYSIRAFARYLELDPSVLAAVFKGRRKIPRNAADRIVGKLALSPQKKQRFIESLYQRRLNLAKLSRVPVLPAKDEQVLQEEAHFHIIADWEHFAIISLCETKNYANDPKLIAYRLGITEVQARTALGRLLKAGLLIEKNRVLNPVNVSVTTTQDVQSAALKLAHRQNLQLSLDKLEQIRVEDRYFGSMTMAIQKEKLPQAKDLLREFQRKLSAFLEEDPKDEVYQLNLQLIPLTKLPEGEV